MDQISQKAMPGAGSADRLPMGGLLALAMAGFLAIVSEAVPAGLLPQIAADLGVSEALAGQLVTACALGSLLSAVPLTAATLRFRRRPLFLAAIAGGVLFNIATAFVESYALLLAARFLAGVSLGLIWALLARYASRMAPDHLAGRAIAVAMLGEPLALLVGVPGGTLVGTAFGWRSTFVIIGLLSIVLAAWVLMAVPDLPGQMRQDRTSLRDVLARPGMATVLLVTFAFVIGDSAFYVYIAPYLSLSGLTSRIELILLLFGGTSLIAIWVTGTLIDRHLRPLMLVSVGGMLLAGLVLALYAGEPAAVYAGVVLWGLAYGGSATLQQTACMRAAGDHADLAQSIYVSCWYGALTVGGIFGGVLLHGFGPLSLPWAMAVLLIPSLLVVWISRRGFE